MARTPPSGIREFDQNVKILILTMHEEEDLVAQCLDPVRRDTSLKMLPLRNFFTHRSPAEGEK